MVASFASFDTLAALQHQMASLDASGVGFLIEAGCR
jgi:hypothetical protein